MQAGIRTPKVRMSTSSGVLTMFGTNARGTTTRGLGHGFPVESGVCSHGRIVAPGTPCTLKYTSGSGGWMQIRSRCGSSP